MGLIKNLIKGMGENKKEIKEKFKEAQQNQKVIRMLEEREKSANQRELERYMEEQRESKIKQALDKIHKKQNADNWKGDLIFKGHKSILHEDTKVLSNDRPILGQKNIFLDNKFQIPMSGKGQFFKW